MHFSHPYLMNWSLSNIIPHRMTKVLQVNFKLVPAEFVQNAFLAGLSYYYANQCLYFFCGIILNKNRHHVWKCDGGLSTFNSQDFASDLAQPVKLFDESATNNYKVEMCGPQFSRIFFARQPIWYTPRLADLVHLLRCAT
ncbi:hypothetical protein SAMN05216436_1149 [bacterium A37T11]|nr:hypothetical protein SAMN05216436_1149 [bacterium A37T11]